MSRVHTALVAAGIALALVVGLVAGSALDVAHADGLKEAGSGTPLVCPTASDAEYDACVDAYRATFETPAPTATPQADGLTGDADAVTCSLVDGCDIDVVDADGETVATMHVTFTDAGKAEITSE